MDIRDFHAAIREGDADRVRKGLARDSSFARVPDETGVRPVLTALYHGQAELAEEIAAARTTPLDLFEAAALGRVVEVRQAITARPEDVTERSADGFTALHLAAFFRRPTVVELLLASKANPDATAENPSKVTPLHSAAASACEASAAALLAAGADPNARQSGGYGALHSAAAHGRIALMRRFLEAGADPELRDDAGASPRDHAAKNDQAEAITLLEGVTS